jgi:hypothetical protein
LIFISLFVNSNSKTKIFIMKKQYLNLSIAAFFFAALTFSTSCSKKSSDDPKPATTPTTTPPPASTKPAAPNTSNKSAANQTEDGTLRIPLTATPVPTSAGSVSVLDQNQQRSQMTNTDNITKLDNLTGKGTTQGRMEAGTTDFGWFISDVTVNGKSYSDQEISANGFDAVFFFNIDDVSGYYWQYHISEDTWAWGTYGIDANMSTIAFDFNDNLVPNEVWEITKLNGNRLVVKGKFNLIEQFEGDTTKEVVIIGLNGYDLSNDEYSGEMEPVLGQETFVGSWERFELVTTLINDPNDPRFGEIDSTYNSLLDKLYINVDGTYSITSSAGNDNGSWVLESIPSEDPTEAPVYYLYPTYYDAENKTIKTDTYVMSIEGDVMVMMDYTDPSNPNPELLYFQRK